MLPYDPATGDVLLVEQFRAGPLLRGAPDAWTLEPVAGIIDPGEDAIAAHQQALAVLQELEHLAHLGVEKLRDQLDRLLEERVERLAV